MKEYIPNCSLKKSNCNSSILASSASSTVWGCWKDANAEPSEGKPLGSDLDLIPESSITCNVVWWLGLLLMIWLVGFGGGEAGVGCKIAWCGTRVLFEAGGGGNSGKSPFWKEKKVLFVIECID